MGPTPSHRKDRPKLDGPQIERRAREIVDAHSHFYRRGDQFEFSYREDVLIIRGTAQSFYLKQVLQTVLHDMVSGACRIDNQVTVASNSGLSNDAVGPRRPPGGDNPKAPDG